MFPMKSILVSVTERTREIGTGLAIVAAGQGVRISISGAEWAK